MKEYRISLKLFIILILVLPACDSEILDQSPQDRYSGPIVWSDINLVNGVLNDCYTQIAWGFGYKMLSMVSDECHQLDGYAVNYVSGDISGDNPRPWDHTAGSYTQFTQSSWGLFNRVQKFNVFLSNIDQVKDFYEGSAKESIAERADRMKGEALFLRAYAYTQLARTYGGVPIITEPFNVGDEYLTFERASFEETVDFILADCDAAASLLGTKNEMEMGRATKEAALALKSRILLFAASDLTADGNAVNKYVGYENPDRQALWTAAKNAALAVMNQGTASLSDFGAPDQQAMAEGYNAFFRQTDLSSPEIIWGKMFDPAVGERHSMNMWNGPNGYYGWGGSGPTANLVDSYQMADGSDFWDHFELDENNYYKNISSTYTNENPYFNREPRFYGSILYDGALWQQRAPAQREIDPLGIYDRRTRIKSVDGQVVSTRFGLDTRKGPFYEWCGTYTGYSMKKMLDHTVIIQSGIHENVWVEFRYAEILLNYAEASLELGETAEAASYINKIRNRSGMPDFTGDITEALRYERQIELVFEDQRFYDIRRWKILEETLTPAMGVDILEKNEDGVTTTTWQRILVEDRKVDPKMYWIPIPINEIQKAPQLIQNPGY
ncbi:MAG: RagB/SusD family nutrient uptake outer membrane protein [Anditalea sp.]